MTVKGIEGAIAKKQEQLVRSKTKTQEIQDSIKELKVSLKEQKAADKAK